MLQLAGLAVAMGNARDSVKVCTDRTTLTNEQDGVAVAIEMAILSTIRLTEIPLDQMNARAKHALMGNLGIQYTYAPGHKGREAGRRHNDRRHRQDIHGSL